MAPDSHLPLRLDDVTALLASSEIIKLFVQPVRVPEQTEVHSALALLVNTSREVEEGCLAVFSGHVGAIQSISSIPILESLRISTVQLAPEDDKEKKSDFAVTFSDPDCSQPLSIIISDHEALQDLLLETRRIMEIAGKHQITAARTQEWTKRFETSSTNANGTLTRSASTARKQLISPPRGLRVRQAANAENPSDIQDVVRTSYINRQLHLKRHEYTEVNPLNVAVLTWNVASKEPKAGCCDWINSAAEDADLVVVGLQEIDMSQAALFQHRPEKQQAWESMLASALASDSWHYTKVASKQLVGLLLVVFLKKELEDRLSVAEINTVATGNLGFANKGAVGCHLKLDDTSMVFLDCHLAAFENMRDRRNEDFQIIQHYMAFRSAEQLDNYTLLTPDIAKQLPKNSMYHSQHTFVFGDLNYRLELSNGEVRSRIERGELDSLKSHDQLASEMKKGVFEGYQEGAITFQPTYRFDPGTSAYDTSEKERTPSWTDRILWFGPDKGDNEKSTSVKEELPAPSIELKQYLSHMGSVFSDHKPVSASFAVSIERVDKEKRAAIRRHVISSLDDFENSTQPKIKLRPNSVEFPHISYGEPMSRSITCENVGDVAAEFLFSPKPSVNEDQPGETFPPWLQVKPDHGLLLPGEVITLILSISLDKTLAASLNSGASSIEPELLILSLTNGRDIFIQVTADGYTPTFLCCPLTGLLRTPGAVANLDREARAKALVRHEGEQLRKLPAELKQITDLLAEHAMHLPNLFVSPAEPKLVRAIRSNISCGLQVDMARLASLRPQLTSRASEMDMGSISLELEKTSASPQDSVSLAFGQLLLDWLDALPIPVVPYELYSRALAAEVRESAYKVLVQFPEAHQVAFMHVIAFLKTYLDRSQTGLSPGTQGSRVDRLAVVFSNVLVRPEPRSFADRAIVGSPAKRKRFLQFFLND